MYRHDADYKYKFPRKKKNTNIEQFFFFNNSIIRMRDQSFVYMSIIETLRGANHRTILKWIISDINMWSYWVFFFS